MKKRMLSLLTVVVLISAVLAGCSGLGSSGASADSGDKKSSLKVGLVTDAGTVDDKSFNQGAWEGISKAVKNFGIEGKYLQPQSKTTADYLTQISNFQAAGYGLIVTTGFMFQEAITQAQKQYPDTHFVLVDTSIENPDKNVTSIVFAEQEAGFLAGISAALKTQSGKVGFIGGMEIPPVQRFGWGYLMGVAYANKEMGTTAQVSDFVYQGTFDDVQGGTSLAAGMYDKGVDIIFTAAGGVGSGAISEAKARAKAGKADYIIGVDIDQYNDGIYDGTKSVILTSAMKRVDNAIYDFIDKFNAGTVTEGEALTYNLSNGGVDLPAENPNLTTDELSKINEAKQKVSKGEVTIAGDANGTKEFLNQYGFITSVKF